MRKVTKSAHLVGKKSREDFSSHSHRGKNIASVDVELFATTSIGNPGGLPTPSFLVPCIVDALRNSKDYLGLVRLVPGEADRFCAAHVIETGGIVLTSDSDLLVYELGDGKVAFFKDLCDDADRVAADTYSPRQICSRLGLPCERNNLSRFAFHLEQSPQASIARLRQLSLQDYRDEDEHCRYQNFCQSYVINELDLPSSNSTEPTLGNLSLQHLDPRLSELISPVTREVSDEIKGNVIFLPTLVETFSRSSAWISGVELRRLAYTIANKLIPGWPQSVGEYKRVLSLGQQAQGINLLGPAGIECTCDVVLDSAKSLRVADPDQQFCEWSLLSILLVSRHYENTGEAESSPIIQFFNKGNRASHVRAELTMCNAIDLTSQLHAVLYSMRILYQVLAMVTSERLSAYNAKFPDLMVLLTTLPSFKDWPDLDYTHKLLHPDNCSWITHVVQQHAYACTSLSPCVQSPELSLSSEAKTWSKKTKRRRSSRKETAIQKSMPNLQRSSNNKFSLLSEEG